MAYNMEYKFFTYGFSRTRQGARRYFTYSTGTNNKNRSQTEATIITKRRWTCSWPMPTKAPRSSQTRNQPVDGTHIGGNHLQEQGEGKDSTDRWFFSSKEGLVRRLHVQNTGHSCFHLWENEWLSPNLPHHKTVYGRDFQKHLVGKWV